MQRGLLILHPQHASRLLYLRAVVDSRRDWTGPRHEVLRSQSWSVVMSIPCTPREQPASHMQRDSKTDLADSAGIVPEHPAACGSATAKPPKAPTGHTCYSWRNVPRACTVNLNEAVLAILSHVWSV